MKAQTVVVDGSPRGCGKLRPGAYLIGQSGPGGGLSPWYWLAAEPWEAQGGGVIRAQVAPRTMKDIDPRNTLASGRLWLAEWTAATFAGGDWQGRWPRFGLVDHVGSQFYPTATSFAEECMVRGPSRRIPPAAAKRLAGLTPFPIFFSHAQVPDCEDQGQAEELLRRFGRPGENSDWSATWLDDRMGPTEDYLWHGLDHPLTRVLIGMWVAVKTDKGVLAGLRFSEAIFGGSWITDVGYLPQGGEDVPDALAEAGVKRMEIEP